MENWERELFTKERITEIYASLPQLESNTQMAVVRGKAIVKAAYMAGARKVVEFINNSQLSNDIKWAGGWKDWKLFVEKEFPNILKGLE